MYIYIYIYNVYINSHIWCMSHFLKPLHFLVDAFTKTPTVHTKLLSLADRASVRGGSSSKGSSKPPHCSWQWWVSGPVPCHSESRLWNQQIFSLKELEIIRKWKKNSVVETLKDDFNQCCWCLVVVVVVVVVGVVVVVVAVGVGVGVGVGVLIRGLGGEGGGVGRLTIGSDKRLQFKFLIPFQKPHL